MGCKQDAGGNGTQREVTEASSCAQILASETKQEAKSKQREGTGASFRVQVLARYTELVLYKTARTPTATLA